MRLADTRSLEALLLGGTLDLFLGVDTSQHALVQREPLCHEPLYLVLSHRAMEAQFGKRYAAVHVDFLRHGADLTQLRGVPFVQGHGSSTTTEAVEQLLLRQSAALDIPIRVSSFDLHIDFCRTGSYATICSRSHLRRVMDCPDADLEVYTVRGVQQTLEIELISHRDAQPLMYRAAFIHMLSEQVLFQDKAICR